MRFRRRAYTSIWKGRTALLTAAASGIGAATKRRGVVVGGETHLPFQGEPYGGAAQFLVRDTDRGEGRGQVRGERDVDAGWVKTCRPGWATVSWGMATAILGTRPRRPRRRTVRRSRVR